MVRTSEQMSLTSRTSPNPPCCTLTFFFHDAASTEIYTLSLHDALPIYSDEGRAAAVGPAAAGCAASRAPPGACSRSEEHTSELQSHVNLVCRLLLEKKKQAKQ